MTKEFLEELEADIKGAYTGSVSTEEAERLAAKFLLAQMEISRSLRDADLDARIKKTGVKALRAALYLEEIKKSDKKPPDSMLEATINNSSLVQSEQGAFDTAEVDRDTLVNYMNIFSNCHIYFRGIAKGSFGS